MRLLLLIMATSVCSAETTNLLNEPLTARSLPDAGLSFLRVTGALVLVVALFLGGVWLYRNWQRLTTQRSGVPKLKVVEVRSLGGRHALYVVGYQQERFLLASSPTGVNMLSHLPTATETEEPATKTTTPPTSFPLMLAQALRGK